MGLIGELARLRVRVLACASQQSSRARSYYGDYDDGGREHNRKRVDAAAWMGHRSHECSWIQPVGRSPVDCDCDKVRIASFLHSVGPLKRASERAEVGGELPLAYDCK